MSKKIFREFVDISFVPFREIQPSDMVASVALPRCVFKNNRCASSIPFFISATDQDRNPFEDIWFVRTRDLWSDKYQEHVIVHRSLIACKDVAEGGGLEEEFCEDVAVETRNFCEHRKRVHFTLRYKAPNDFRGEEPGNEKKFLIPVGKRKGLSDFMEKRMFPSRDIPYVSLNIEQNYYANMCLVLRKKEGNVYPSQIAPALERSIIKTLKNLPVTEPQKLPSFLRELRLGQNTLGDSSSQRVEPTVDFWEKRISALSGVELGDELERFKLAIKEATGESVTIEDYEEFRQQGTLHGKKLDEGMLSYLKYYRIFDVDWEGLCVAFAGDPFEVGQFKTLLKDFQHRVGSLNFSEPEYLDFFICFWLGFFPSFSLNDPQSSQKESVGVLVDFRYIEALLAYDGVERFLQSQLAENRSSVIQRIAVLRLLDLLPSKDWVLECLINSKSAKIRLEIEGLEDKIKKIDEEFSRSRNAGNEESDKIERLEAEKNKLLDIKKDLTSDLLILQDECSRNQETIEGMRTDFDSFFSKLRRNLSSDETSLFLLLIDKIKDEKTGISRCLTYREIAPKLDLGSKQAVEKRFKKFKKDHPNAGQYITDIRSAKKTVVFSGLSPTVRRKEGIDESYNLDAS